MVSEIGCDLCGGVTSRRRSADHRGAQPERQQESYGAKRGVALPARFGHRQAILRCLTQTKVVHRPELQVKQMIQAILRPVG